MFAADFQTLAKIEQGKSLWHLEAQGAKLSSAQIASLLLSALPPVGFSGFGDPHQLLVQARLNQDLDQIASADLHPYDPRVVPAGFEGNYAEFCEERWRAGNLGAARKKLTTTQLGQLLGWRIELMVAAILSRLRIKFTWREGPDFEVPMYPEGAVKLEVTHVHRSPREAFKEHTLRIKMWGALQGKLSKPYTDNDTVVLVDCTNLMWGHIGRLKDTSPSEALNALRPVLAGIDPHKRVGSVLFHYFSIQNSDNPTTIAGLDSWSLETARGPATLRRVDGTVALSIESRIVRADVAPTQRVKDLLDQTLMPHEVSTEAVSIPRWP